MSMEFGKLVNKEIVPATITDWQEPDERRVGWTERDGIQVSTVFLHINHGFGGTDEWFETMVFGGELDGECERYATYEEAEAGHAEICRRVFGDDWPEVIEGKA